MTKSRTDFTKAEALGHIQTMPELTEATKVEVPKSDVIDNPEDFRMAIAEAQMAGADHVVVSERVLKYLLRGNKSESLTYGEPGIRVFLEGTKDEIERVERFSAEQYHEHHIKKMRGL